MDEKQRGLAFLQLLRQGLLVFYLLNSFGLVYPDESLVWEERFVREDYSVAEEVIIVKPVAEEVIIVKPVKSVKTIEAVKPIKSVKSVKFVKTIETVEVVKPEVIASPARTAAVCRGRHWDNSQQEYT